MSMFRRGVCAAAFALAVSGAGLAIAETGVPGDPNPSVVSGGAYGVEPLHTRVLFSVSHMGFSTWYGEFTGAAGQLSLDPAHLAASKLDVTIPVASVSTSNAKLDGELKSPDWLDAAGFPTITFHSTSVRRTGPSTADVAGDLTFHGVTRPVVLHAAFKGAGVNPLTKHYTSGFDVTGRIKRSDFGVKTYVPLIGDDVDLIISGAFEKTGG